MAGGLHPNVAEQLFFLDKKIPNSSAKRYADQYHKFCFKSHNIHEINDDAKNTHKIKNLKRIRNEVKARRQKLYVLNIKKVLNLTKGCRCLKICNIL